MKTCSYCGKVNPDDALACGDGQWDGCGGTLPIQTTLSTTPTSTSLTSSSISMIGTKPHPVSPRMYHRPGKTMRQFRRDIEMMKEEIGLALLPALQATLRQWGRR